MISIINAHPIFIIIATFCSLWVTWHVPSIHSVKSWHDFVLAQLIHQYILNLSGSVIGWVALYYFIFEKTTSVLTITDLVVALIAYVGIMGYLPHLVINKGFKP